MCFPTEAKERQRNMLPGLIPRLCFEAGTRAIASRSAGERDKWLMAVIKLDPDVVEVDGIWFI